MIRFGIVGFGLHAAKRLMPGFSRSRQCEVSALSRRDLGRARETAAKYAIPQAFGSAEELCQSELVDAVFITTPHSLPLHDVMTAVANRKPVLCEKPMAMNAAECRKMVEAAREANVLLGVAQVFRFENSVNRMRQRIAAGDIGRPVFARAEFSFTAAAGHPRTWIGDAAVAGGGPIFDVGVHCIDALRYILNDEVVRVSAHSSGQLGSVETAAVLTLQFSRGTLGSVMVSFRAEYRTPIEVVGETGVLRADDGLNVERPITLELRRDGRVVDQETTINADAYARQVDAFADAVQRGDTFPVPGEEGWQNQEVLDAAYRSIPSGRTEDVSRVS